MGCERLLHAQLILVVLLCLPSPLASARLHSSQEVEVVYPTLVDRHGRPLSSSLAPWSSGLHRRGRRSVRLGEDVYLNISGRQHHFLLRLAPNRRLLAPGFRVYVRHHGNQSAATAPDDRLGHDLAPDLDPDCLMAGDVIEPSHGRAAISLCSAGVTGVLQLGEDDYVIEPLTGQEADDVTLDRDRSPHVIYQRASLRMSEQFFEAQEGESYGHVADSLLELPASLRARRSLHKHRHGHGLHPRGRRVWQVETLVVVDKTMYWRHGKSNITDYVLSIFNIVSQLFSDASLGAKVQIVLVGLVLLDGDEPGLTISHHADKTLNSFCQWQSLLTGDNGKHHDHAILLSGLDICSYKDAPCDTLGFAPIKGMCSPLRSCIVNQDTGLTTAFTVAHEIGHNFGLFHDGDGNYCKQAPGNIMAPTLTGHNGKFRWSVCSRGYMQRFLGSPQASCLEDDALSVPQLKFPDRLPGELFDATTQCRWQFGAHAQVCSFETHQHGRMCQTLWCLRGEQMCETKFLPAAEGTECGPGMWCRHGSCVQREAVGPVPVDGGWSEWSDWSQCSKSCGGGVMQRERHCNNPSPAHGGEHCDGDSEMFKMCSLEDCPGGRVDPRWEQCQHHNRQPFRGWYYKWKPYKQVHHVEDQCKLYCQAENFNFFYALADEVEDGTRCNDLNNDICIKGVCKPVGCDLVINSDAKNDRCGVCKGDNSTCQVITGVYTEQPKHDTYFPIVVLPRGARSIVVREREVSLNYLALRNIYGDYYLNGHRRMHWAGKYSFGGSLFSYLRPASEPESLASQGPLGEDLVLEMLVKGWNPGIEYEYTLPKSSQVPVRVPPFNCRWELAVYGCSRPCAGGERITEAHCVCGEGKNVSDSLCDMVTKPKTQIEPCNTDPCPARWVIQDWGKCSKPCAGGKQKRKVKCRQEVSEGVDRKLKPRDCSHLPRPPRKRPCNTQSCPPSWQKGRWSQCSSTCGRGARLRDVGCYSQTTEGTKPMPDVMCQGRPRPRSTRPCNRPPCHKFQWVISSWSYCSVTCGSGVMVRTLRCVRQKRSGQLVKTRDRHCLKVAKPDIDLEQPCGGAPCGAATSPSFSHPPSRPPHLDVSPPGLRQSPGSPRGADSPSTVPGGLGSSTPPHSPRNENNVLPADSPRSPPVLPPALPRTVGGSGPGFSKTSGPKDSESPDGVGTSPPASPRSTGTSGHVGAKDLGSESPTSVRITETATSVTSGSRGSTSTSASWEDAKTSLPPTSSRTKGPDLSKEATVSSAKKSDPSTPTSVIISSAPSAFLTISTTNSKGRTSEKTQSVSPSLNIDGYTPRPPKSESQENLQNADLPSPSKDDILVLSPSKSEESHEVDFTTPSQSGKATIESSSSVNRVPVNTPRPEGVSTGLPPRLKSHDVPQITTKIFVPLTNNFHTTSPKSNTATNADNVSKISSHDASITKSLGGTTSLSTEGRSPTSTSSTPLPPVESSTSHAHSPGAAHGGDQSKEKTHEKDVSDMNLTIQKVVPKAESADEMGRKPHENTQPSSLYPSTKTATSAESGSRITQPAVGDGRPSSPSPVTSTKMTTLSNRVDLHNTDIRNVSSDRAVSTSSTILSPGHSGIATPSSVSHTSVQKSDQGSTVAPTQTYEGAKHTTTNGSVGTGQQETAISVIGVTESRTPEKSRVTPQTVHGDHTHSISSSSSVLSSTSSSASTGTASTQALRTQLPEWSTAPTAVTSHTVTFDPRTSDRVTSRQWTPPPPTTATTESLLKAHWVTSLWSQCSVTCGEGEKVRLVRCMDIRQRHMTASACTGTPPPSRQQCFQGPCPPPGPACVDAYPWCRLVPVHNICNHSFYGRKCCHSCRGYK